MTRHIGASAKKSLSEDDIIIATRGGIHISMSYNME